MFTISLDMHDSFFVLIGSQNVLLVVKEKDGAILLRLVLVMSIITVLGEELQVSGFMFISIEGLEDLLGVVDVIICVDKD